MNILKIKKTELNSPLFLNADIISRFFFDGEDTRIYLKGDLMVATCEGDHTKEIATILTSGNENGIYAIGGN